MYLLFYTKDNIETTFTGLAPSNKMGKIYETIHKYKWINIGINTIIPLFSILYTTFCLYISFFLFDSKIKLKIIAKAAIKSQFIFAFAFLFKLFWYYIKGIDNLFELNIMPFSLASFFDIGYGDFDNSWLLFSLNSLNIFELAYMLFIPIALVKSTSLRYKNLLKPTLWGYVTGLFLYLVLISLLTLTF
jgi:hypothetical protein